MKVTRIIALLVLLLGVGGLILGGVFIGQGVSKKGQLTEAMRVEHITLGIETELTGEVIDTMDEAIIAGDTIREHRRGIAPTYSDLLGDGRFNPEDTDQLSYAQALNLETYLYLAGVGLGLAQALIGSGVFMVVTGLALAGTGVVLYRTT